MGKSNSGRGKERREPGDTDIS